MAVDPAAIQIPRPGDPIRASTIAAIIGAVRDSAGTDGPRRGDGADQDAVRVGRIASVLGAGDPLGDWPSRVTYDVAVLGAGVVGRAMTPELGRPVAGDACRIVPAAVGDPCLLVRVPDPDGGAGAKAARLVVLTETLAFAPCAEPTPTPGITP